jgi:hypothetical protein
MLLPVSPTCLLQSWLMDAPSPSWFSAILADSPAPASPSYRDAHDSHLKQALDEMQAATTPEALAAAMYACRVLCGVAPLRTRLRYHLGFPPPASYLKAAREELQYDQLIRELLEPSTLPKA